MNERVVDRIQFMIEGISSGIINERAGDGGSPDELVYERALGSMNGHGKVGLGLTGYPVSVLSQVGWNRGNSSRPYVWITGVGRGLFIVSTVLGLPTNH